MKKRLKRILSFWLSYIILFLCPINAYASVHSVSNADYTNEEPFYYDENGNKVYDSDIDWSQYRTEPNYNDILWTFEEYPETMMTSGDMDTYIVGADDAVVIAVVAAACAACGVAIARSDIPEFVSKGFEPWLRRNKGADTATMNMWQSLFKTAVGTTFVGMKLLAKNIHEFLQSLTMSDTAVSVPVNSSVRGTHVCPGFNNDEYEYMYTTFEILDDFTVYYDYAFLRLSFDSLVCGYLERESPIGSGNYVVRLFKSTDNISVGHSLSLYRYSQFYFDAGYWDSSGSSVNCTPVFPYELIYTFTFPIFVNSAALKSWINYGTTGGITNGDADDFLSINTANQWTDLKQDFLTRWAISDTFNIPNTQEALDSLVDSLSKAQTGTDVITNLNTVWTITDTGGGGDIVVSPSAAYSSLCYVLSALAGYAGATLTDEQKDSFITSFYTGNIDGTAALVDEQAQAIVRNFVVINGGSQSPDDNNDNNKYKVLKKLAVSLGAFLVSAGLVSDSPDFENQPSVSSNVQVVENQSPDVPTPNPDTGTDLSGVLGYLKQFLDILLIWANPLSLMDSLISKLGLPTLTDGIKSAINNLPKLINGELRLPELFGNVTDAIFSLPQQVADAISKALNLDGALSKLGLSDLFDNMIELLPDKLVEGFALPDLFSGLGTVVGRLPQAVAELFGMSNEFSLRDFLEDLKYSFSTMPQAFAEKFKPLFDKSSSDSSESEKDDGSGGFKNILDFLILLIAIIIMLLILFINCLKFIVFIFNIPASTALFNEHILSGIDYLKTIQMPFSSTGNLSLYEFLMACAYFVIFFSIIAALRKKIDKLHY